MYRHLIPFVYCIPFFYVLIIIDTLAGKNIGRFMTLILDFPSTHTLNLMHTGDIFAKGIKLHFVSYFLIALFSGGLFIINNMRQNIKSRLGCDSGFRNRIIICVWEISRFRFPEA